MIFDLQLSVTVTQAQVQILEQQHQRLRDLAVATVRAAANSADAGVALRKLLATLLEKPPAPFRAALQPAYSCDADEAAQSDEDMGPLEEEQQEEGGGEEPLEEGGGEELQEEGEVSQEGGEEELQEGGGKELQEEHEGEEKVEEEEEEEQEEKEEEPVTRASLIKALIRACQTGVRLPGRYHELMFDLLLSNKNYFNNRMGKKDAAYNRLEWCFNIRGVQDILAACHGFTMEEVTCVVTSMCNVLGSIKKRIPGMPTRPCPKTGRLLACSATGEGEALKQAAMAEIRAKLKLDFSGDPFSLIAAMGAYCLSKKRSPSSLRDIALGTAAAAASAKRPRSSDDGEAEEAEAQREIAPAAAGGSGAGQERAIASEAGGSGAGQEREGSAAA